MRIGMLLREQYPPDIRVDKEMRMLTEQGHQLFLLCFGRGGRVGDELRDDGVTVRYLQPYRSLWKRRLTGWLFCFVFRSPLWERAIERFVQDFDIQALHVHDLPLVGPAVRLAEKQGLPVVADLHENYPSAIQNYHGSWLRNKLFYNYHRWTRYETRACRSVARVLCVIEESAAHLVENGVPAERIVIISNVSPPDLAQAQVDPSVIAKYQDRFVISYIGGFGPHRGVDVAIRAMRWVRQQAPNALLLLAGRGPDWYMQQVDALIADPQVADAIEFVGWRPLEAVPSLIAASDVCLVPHNAGIQTHASAPHKLFQYWMMHRPVVVSNCRSLQRMAERSGGAAVFEAGDPQDLARVLTSLYQSPERCQELAAKGYEMALGGEYSWARTREKLNRVYAELEGK